MESITSKDQDKQAGQTTGSIIHIGHLLAHLRRVKDGRKRRGIRYPMEIILALFILAKLCGENKVYGIADWVQLRSTHLIQALDLKLAGSLFGLSKTTRPILVGQLSNSLLLKGQCRDWDAQRWVLKVLKQLKSKLDASKPAKSPLAAC